MVFVTAAREGLRIGADTATDGSAAVGSEREADLERLGDEIAELAAHLHAARYRLLVRLRAFDERGGWGGGFRSCAHWLSWRTGIGLGAAREQVRVARALEQLPLLGEAMRRGEVSFAKIRAATRVATPDNEERLLDLARHGTASHVEKVVRAWRQVDRLAEQTAERERHRSRALTLYFDDDGMAVLRGRLDPEVGALLERALAAACEALYGRRGAAEAAKAAAAAGMEPATVEQRRADAIGLIAECALRSGLAMDAPPEATARGRPDSPALANRAAGIVHPAGCSVSRAPGAVSGDPGTVGHASDAMSGSDAMSRASDVLSPDSEAMGRETGSVSPVPATRSRADRFQVVVHVDAAALREAGDAGQAVLADTRISAETSRRLACDASRVFMTHDTVGTVLDVGRRSRTVPPAIRRALEQRDRGCRFPGCGLRYCDVHHIRHWADGGTTRLDNLVYVCRVHHRALHEDGFRVAFTGSREFRFYRPDGQPILDAPPAPRLPADPGAALAAAHSGAGLEIDASTTASSWAGERLDVDFALLTMRGP